MRKTLCVLRALGNQHTVRGTSHRFSGSGETVELLEQFSGDVEFGLKKIVQRPNVKICSWHVRNVRFQNARARSR